MLVPVICQNVFLLTHLVDEKNIKCNANTSFSWDNASGMIDVNAMCYQPSAAFYHTWYDYSRDAQSFGRKIHD